MSPADAVLLWGFALFAGIMVFMAYSTVAAGWAADSERLYWLNMNNLTKDYIDLLTYGPGCHLK